MKKTVFSVTLLSILVGGSWAYADGLSFRFSTDAIAIAYNLYPIRDQGSAEFGWVHNKNDRDVLTAGFFANGQRDQLSGRLGAKAYWSKIRKDEGAGLAFGGDLNFMINETVSLFAKAYWGPSTIAFGDIKGYKEGQLGANIQVFDNSIVAVSYGSLRIKTDAYGQETVDDGLSVGLKMQF